MAVWIVRWTNYVVQDQQLGPAFAVFQEVWGQRPNPATITVLLVAGLANPAYLAEIDAIAVVPQ